MPQRLMVDTARPLLLVFSSYNVVDGFMTVMPAQAGIQGSQTAASGSLA